MKYAKLNYDIQKAVEETINPPAHHIDVTVDDCKITMGDTIYEPFPTLKEFHADPADVKIIIGPFGSGKSSALTLEIVRHACAMPICKDGIRRARWLIVRNTYDELKSTSLQMWEEWTHELGIIKTNRQPPVTWGHTFYDKRGRIELEVVFLALNSELQLRKLGSYNITAAYLNEARELPKSVLQFVSSRTGRYPAQRLLGEGVTFWHGVIADTNPPPVKHWIPELEQQPEIKYKQPDGTEKTIRVVIYHQPPSLLLDEKGIYIPNPAAENINNLPGGYDYYFKMLANGEDYVRVYALGQYGTLRSGQPVYAKYNDDLHSVDEIEIEPNLPIIMGVDYGRICPAIVCCQYVCGQLRAIKEFVGDHIYIRDLANQDLIPWLQESCPTILYDDDEVLDAHGFDDVAQTDEGREQLLALGLDVRPARTNKVEPRLTAVNELLGRLTSTGNPALLISREGCPRLREGFISEYKLEESRTISGNMYRETPTKSHPHSDIHDGLQYVALEYVAGPEYEEEDLVCPEDLYASDQKSAVTGY